MMPQASDELRDIIVRWFGDIDAGPVVGYLETRGCVFLWEAPNYGLIRLPSPEPDDADFRNALLFLIQEWDFGVAKTEIELRERAIADFWAEEAERERSKNDYGER